MAKIFLALGSNVGDKRRNIESAVELLSLELSDIRRAPVYFSKAMYHEKQPDFANTIISAMTDLSPEEILAFVKNIESTLGRVHRFRNGPREIDIDIIFYEDMIMSAPGLIIPHERLHERDFVLRPLADLDPDFIHPVLRKSVAELLSELPAASSIFS